MRKLKPLVIIFTFAIILNVPHAQPKYKISFKGGYNIPLDDLKGNVYDSVDQVHTYVMNHGYNFGADVKLNWAEIKNISFTFGIGYNMFVNTEENVNGTGKDAEYKINALVLGAGIEYDFIPKGKVNPFIGVEFTGHFFNGSKELVHIAGDKTELDLHKAARYGIAAGLGIDFGLSKSIGISAGSKYQLANLIGKDSTSYSLNKFGLNDAEFIYNGDTVPARTISYLQFYAGVSFYFYPQKEKNKIRFF